MPWVLDANAGGIKIPPRLQAAIRQRIVAHAEKHHGGRYTRIDVRFKGVFCYIDAYREPVVPKRFPPPGWPETRQEYLERLRSTPTHLCRLRHFAPERWSVAFYTYSHETYEPTFFESGSCSVHRRRAST